MKGNAHRLENKARKLMRLYSLWHETRKEEFQRQYLNLLGEILLLEPRFSMRRELHRVAAGNQAGEQTHCNSARDRTAMQMPQIMMLEQRTKPRNVPVGADRGVAGQIFPEKLARQEVPKSEGKPILPKSVARRSGDAL